MQKKRTLILIALAAASLTALSGCTWFSPEQPVETDDLSVVTDTTFCKGIVICGVDVSGMTKEQALSVLSRRQETPDPFSITLTMDDEVFTYTEQDFKIDTDYKTAVNEAYDYLYYGKPEQYYGKKLMLSTSPKEFGAGQSINKKSLEEKLNELADSLDKDPVEPTVVSFQNKKFTFSDGENGLAVKREKLIADVEKALETSNTVSVEIQTKVVKPKASKEDYAGEMKKLGSFSTVSTNNENGNKNMALALNYINGATIAPGETFSFEALVGDSTNDSRGFLPAGAIVNGKLVDSYGGGICQASTTIYGAAIRSNMTIVERYNHMWPSSYVPIGQDAAVDYGIQDFKFRNDTDYPIYIQCSMSGTTLSATLYGYQSDEYDKIEVESQQTGTLEQPEAQYVEDQKLKKGEIETERPGRSGQTAAAQRVFYKNGAVVKTEDLPNSYYPSIGAIYHYGPGTKLEKNE